MPPLPRRFGPCALALLALAIAGVAPETAGRWVGTWAASPQLTEPGNMPPAPGLADSTLRQIVRATIGGEKVRVRFSNAFGKSPLRILSARVARSAGGGAIVPGTEAPLLFSGRPEVRIPPGAPMVTDAVSFPIAPLSDLVVTIRVQDPTVSVTGHPGSRCTSYLAAGDAVEAIDMPSAAKVLHWYYLCGVDVESSDASAVAVLGDSITDGRGSTTDGNDRWTDQLARRLRSDPRTASVAVLNQGLGGNRLLADGLGPAALSRLDRDVLAQPGVRWLIVLEGINDLGTGSARAPDLIAAYEQIIERAHARGIRAYGATILPCAGHSYFRPEREADRQAVNAWIRTSGRFDAVIDFDAATRDPSRPEALSQAADGGDHLHPGPEGYRIMAEAVDPALFAR